MVVVVVVVVVEVNIVMGLELRRRSGCVHLSSQVGLLKNVPHSVTVMPKGLFRYLAFISCYNNSHQFLPVMRFAFFLLYQFNSFQKDRQFIALVLAYA